ncbi:MAG: hypothetical protein HY718_14080 [Planctomycetes bacterium]|nr:hypothetical protein [Planctomycetota bacterium]
MLSEPVLRLGRGTVGVASSWRRWSVVLAGLVLTIGCDKPLFPSLVSGPAMGGGGSASQPTAAKVDSAGPAAPGPMPTAASASVRPAVLVTRITFDVLRVRVPQGLFSQSEKIWNHLETSFLPAETIGLLHRNGLRVGRGGADAWPPIRAILETTPRVETSQSSLTLNNGRPLSLEMDLQPKDQILFLYRRDGTLSGAPWRSSSNLLRIEYGISPTNADAVTMEIMPELRLDSASAQGSRGPERWNPTAGLVEPGLVIRELAFRVETAAGEFVVVGPSSATRELPYIAGSLMLREEKEGEKFESVYFLTPTVSRAGGP